MTVHMFRVVAEKPTNIGETQANQLVNEWLSAHTPWAEDPTSHEITLVDPVIDNAPTHFRGDLRFERDSEMATIREQMATDLAGVAEWYQIAYHKCTHDENDGGPCEWDAVETHGTIPSEVPTIEVA